jgi:hypothetical protein
MLHQGPKGSIENDKVLLEGWWKKKGGKGHINQKTGKHRYFILTPRYLDWYEKPGYKRCGTVSLDQIYVRKQPDNITLVVGQFGGKEFKITSEGQDPETRTEDWYKDIQKAMENVKKVDKKTVLNEGFDKKKISRDSSPQRKSSVTSESTPIVPSTTNTEASPPVPQTQSAPQLQTPDQQQSQIMPPPTQSMPQQTSQQPQMQQQSQMMPQQSQMMPQHTPQMQQSQLMPQMQQQAQMMPQMQQTMMSQQIPGQVQMQTSYQQPMMQTVVQPQMVSGVSYTQQIPTMNTGVVIQQSPIATTTSFSPFGVQQTFATPVVNSFAASQTICIACRRPFPIMPGQMMRCPYCLTFVGGAATTVVQ